MSTRMLGVIGGMGPQASASFYDLIIENTDAQKDQDHIDLILYSHASIPDRTESILKNDTDELLDMLKNDIQKLSEFGADYVVLTCNTSHLFIDELQCFANVPIISMIDSTVQYLNEKNILKVGLMATDGTIQKRIYSRKLEEAGIETITPHGIMQKNVMHIIYEEVKKGNPVDDLLFNQVSEELRTQGAEAIVLGCTELSYYGEQKKLDDFFVDPQRILARKCIELCGGAVTKE